MSLMDELSALAQYDAWANQRLLAIAREIPPAQLAAPAQVSHESILGNFRHVVTAQANWLGRWTGEFHTPEDLADLESLGRAYGDVAEWLQQFLPSQDEAALERVVVYRYGQGRTLERRLSTLVFQVINHGTYHRGETAMALTALGHSPGDLDYVYYTFERDGIRRD